MPDPGSRWCDRNERVSCHGRGEGRRVQRQALLKRGGLIAVPVLALVAAGLTFGSTSAATANKPARFQPTDRDFYINWVEPKAERNTDGKEVSGPGKVKQPRPDPVSAYGRKFSEGNPVAGRGLAKL